MLKNITVLKFLPISGVLRKEPVFRRVICVFWILFKLLKLIKPNNGVNSTLFLFSRFHQISVDVVLCQNTQNFITFMARWEFFSHLTMKVCRDLERGSKPELHQQIRRERCFTLFYVGSGDLGASILAQKMGYRTVFC